MSDNSDELQRLWQQQQVTSVNVALLKKQWKMMRTKQYLYIALDALAALMIPLVIFIFPRELEKFEMIWLATVFFLVTLLFFYLLWLRRFSLSFKNTTTNTSDYVTLLKRQYRQNIRIAKLNKALCFLTPMIFVVYVLIGYLGDFLPAETVWRKGKIMFLVCLIAMPLCWLWAHKRVQKFEHLLADFETRFAR